MLSKIFIACIFLIIGTLLGTFFGKMILPAALSPAIQKEVANPNCQYKLINPVFCNPQPSKSHLNTAHLEGALQAYINKAKKDKKVTRAGVYYRDLENGPIIGIDAYEDYYGGSLLKVPVMLFYLKQAEQDPSILDKKFTVDDSITPTQLKNPNQAALSGHSYTVRDLIGKMIIYSDNASKDVLEKGAPGLFAKDEPLSNVYTDLGLDDSTYKSGALTLEQYASIFTIIYNSQYLSNAMSEQALDIMSKGDYHRGIVAGVPKDTIVANKFGIPGTQANKPQLHDCGIVYHPRGPYVLCVFTEGTDYFAMEKVIAGISKIVYDGVNRN
jgi:beta-lactamase class A